MNSNNNESQKPTGSQKNLIPSSNANPNDNNSGILQQIIGNDLIKQQTNKILSWLDFRKPPPLKTATTNYKMISCRNPILPNITENLVKNSSTTPTSQGNNSNENQDKLPENTPPNRQNKLSATNVVNSTTTSQSNIELNGFWTTSKDLNFVKKNSKIKEIVSPTNIPTATLPTSGKNSLVCQYLPRGSGRIRVGNHNQHKVICINPVIPNIPTPPNSQSKELNISNSSNANSISKTKVIASSGILQNTVAKKSCDIKPDNLKKSELCEIRRPAYLQFAAKQTTKNPPTCKPTGTETLSNKKTDELKAPPAKTLQICKTMAGETAVTPTPVGKASQTPSSGPPPSGGRGVLKPSCGHPPSGAEASKPPSSGPPPSGAEASKPPSSGPPPSGGGESKPPSSEPPPSGGGASKPPSSGPPPSGGGESKPPSSGPPSSGNSGGPTPYGKLPTIKPLPKAAPTKVSNVKKYGMFNSQTLQGRANVAKATLGTILVGMIYLKWKYRNTNKNATVSVDSTNSSNTTRTQPHRSYQCLTPEAETTPGIPINPADDSQTINSDNYEPPISTTPTQVTVKDTSTSASLAASPSIQKLKMNPWAKRRGCRVYDIDGTGGSYEETKTITDDPAN